ncbi:MAG: putative DNA-binding domain-containing protein [Acidobacteriota bacterium]
MSREQRSEAAISGRRLAIATRSPHRSRRRSSLRVAPEPGTAPAPLDVPLDTVQRWMQAVIVHPGSVDEAIEAEEAAREVPPEQLAAVVRPSWSLSAAERVEIYHGMYLLRMVEALETDYPAIRHFLGEEPFEELVRDYVQRYPSRSYTLNRLGDRLPQFFLDEPDRRHAAFLHDLARTELAVSQAFDEEESAVLGPEAIQQVPAEAWSGARLRPIRAFRLLTLCHPVSAHLDAAKLDLPAPRPRRRASFLAVYRRDYSVYRLDLSRPEYELLAALTGGTPLGEALGTAARHIKESRRADTVFRWFRSWVAEGMFSALET